MTHRKFLFLLSSARSGGNSESLARAAAASLPADVTQDWRDLRETHLPAFEDLRHAGGYGPLTGASADWAARTMAATDLVFVAPLYWYGLPGAAKTFLDHWSHWLRIPALEFKPRMASKTLWLVMAHAGSEPAQIQPAIDTLRWTADYLNMRWGGALLGDANAPGDLAKDKAALDRAGRFFQTRD